MTAMQKELGAQSLRLTDGDCFDMWHDYLELGKVLERLRGTREVDHRGTEGPKEKPTTPWGHVQTSSGSAEYRNSAETSSASSQSDNGTSSDYCRFCKQNGESLRIYRSHRLKSEDGKIVCPILRSYTCPICETTGDYAHTRRYCPQAREAAKGLPRSSFW
ncbi:nanos homolog 1-like [Toxotes jaculatrix]|uniref:nanos homolog 1-like n=1 Tax=Toxotes jaculatrix TaxID=941984 RepID=UPI001B3AB25A|nr:nanos homolog 1-like [Toxotes jaculatrix]